MGDTLPESALPISDAKAAGFPRQPSNSRVASDPQSSGFAVPDDFSIIGLDDIAVALHSRPPLTTIRIDRVELGRAGIQMLMKRIADPGASIVRVNIGMRLVERATVGPVRKTTL